MEALQGVLPCGAFVGYALRNEGEQNAIFVCYIGFGPHFSVKHSLLSGRGKQRGKRPASRNEKEIKRIF